MTQPFHKKEETIAQFEIPLTYMNNFKITTVLAMNNNSNNNTNPNNSSFTNSNDSNKENHKSLEDKCFNAIMDIRNINGTMTDIVERLLKEQCLLLCEKDISLYKCRKIALFIEETILPAIALSNNNLSQRTKTLVPIKGTLEDHQTECFHKRKC